MVGAGIFLMVEAYRAIHTKTAATPLTKAKTALGG